MWWNDTNREIDVGLPGQNHFAHHKIPKYNILTVCAFVLLAAGFIMLQSVFD